MGKLSEIERTFYKDYASAVGDYLQAYIWRFVLYSLLVALGAWMAFSIMKSYEQERTFSFLFKPCKECQEKKEKEADKEALPQEEGGSNE